MVSPSNLCNFSVLTWVHAVSNSSWGLGAVRASGILLFLSFVWVSCSTSCLRACRRLPGLTSQSQLSAQQNWSNRILATNRLEHKDKVRSWVLQTGVLVSALLFPCCASQGNSFNLSWGKMERKGFVTSGNAETYKVRLFLSSSFHWCPLRERVPEISMGLEEDKYSQLRPLLHVLPCIFKEQLLMPGDVHPEEQRRGTRMLTWWRRTLGQARNFTARQVTTQRTQLKSI